MLGVMMSTCHPSQDVNLSGIVQELDVKCPIKVLPYQFGSTWIIRNRAEYDAYLDSIPCTSSVNDNRGIGIGDIDFSQSSVLSFITKTHGCKVWYEREFSAEQESKTCHYVIRQRSYGDCSNEWLSTNLVEVERIPNDWVVEFQAE